MKNFSTSLWLKNVLPESQCFIVWKANNYLAQNLGYIRVLGARKLKETMHHVNTSLEMKTIKTIFAEFNN